MAGKLNIDWHAPDNKQHFLKEESLNKERFYKNIDFMCVFMCWECNIELKMKWQTINCDRNKPVEM